jgi:hypothetical protein
MEIECKKCHRKFTDKINDYPMHVYNHKGEALCADCLIGMGVLTDHNDASHDNMLIEAARFMVRPN